MVFALEARGIAASLGVLDIDRLAVGSVGPAVVVANDELRVAALLAAQHRTLVPADVQKGANAALSVPHDQDWARSDIGRDVVVGLGELALEREKTPCLPEDLLLLQLEDRGVRKDVRVDLEHAVFWTVVDVCLDGLQWIHVGLCEIDQPFLCWSARMSDIAPLSRLAASSALV